MKGMIGMLGGLPWDQFLQIVGDQDILLGGEGRLVARGRGMTIEGEDHLQETETEIDLDLLCIVPDIALGLPEGALQKGTIVEDLHQGGDHLLEDTTL